jgi:hypothetical protein
MVVVASMIGAEGFGEDVLEAPQHAFRRPTHPRPPGDPVPRADPGSNRARPAQWAAELCPDCVDSDGCIVRGGANGCSGMSARDPKAKFNPA